MEDNIKKLTKFLLESARAAHQKGKRFDKLINKLRLDVEKLDEEFDSFRDNINLEFCNELFQLNGVPEDDFSRDPIMDIMSIYFFENRMNIDTCMDKLNEQLKLIKEARELG